MRFRKALAYIPFYQDKDERFRSLAEFVCKDLPSG
jgi:hypothetical protein